MGETTKIQWCDATLNLWWGCTKVSEGCKFCYAENLSDGRFKALRWGPKGTRQEVKSWRTTLAKISNRAFKENRRLRVFCQSMSDTFEGGDTCGGFDSENWATMSRLRIDLMEAIINHPHLDFLLLTKRPENAKRFFDGFGRVPDNIWMGTSVENQETANERIPHLRSIPARIRFLSCEPLLGPISLGAFARWITSTCGDGVNGYYEEEIGLLEDIHWVIVGGESGKNARSMYADWARHLKEQCEEFFIPFFFKQWGKWIQCEKTGEFRLNTENSRLLGGREWSEFPQ